MSAKPIIVVHPDTATKSVKQVLSRAGYAVLVSDHPEHFTALEVLPVAAGNLIARAALRTIRDQPHQVVDAAFGANVASAMLKASKPTEGR